jgi:hypothetical protein
MPPTLTRKRIRLQVFADQDSAIKDYLTGATPVLWRGNDVQIELGIFFGAEVVDVTNIASVTVEAKESQTSPTSPVISKLVDDLNAALTLATWQDGTGAHAVIPLTATETNIDLDGAAEKSFWLTVSAITTDAYAITLGTSYLQIREDNAGTAGTPPTNDPTYLTAAETTALVASKAEQSEVDSLADDVDALEASVSSLADDVAALMDTSDERRDATPMVSGQDYVDVVFAEDMASSSYRIDGSIINTIDGDPLNIMRATVSARSVSGFRQRFSAAPDTANYVFEWHCVLN